ncbi:hypothetical protein PLESTB_001623000 [Pleodorina starrii]|uniref:Uncharacterized protein n=1 Tax=Pleodorina starrii TaxID=330485 RepID=A0A9W6F8S4_9CHLO|nr:hypothetical protein PLESTM_002040600 [Pleodorina starrii]GLC60523.1 hypothetical protein PLESTB_001623000 [Pleodorina starrii]
MFRSFRKLSGFAAEDIPVMSKVFTTWPAILKVGSAVVIATQAFTALQLRIDRVGIEKKLEGVEKKVEETDKRLQSVEKKVEETDKRLQSVEKKVEDVAAGMRLLGMKLDQALKKEG